ncbi:MAG TPA: protein kinase [Polyangiaceae bacterium]|nr:protein kinase [Polyangiaceae bacterium]
MLTPDQPVLAHKYRLIGQLGAGGMGSVWLARHVDLDSLVAVKLMGKEVAATPAGTERFLREARTAASLRSPHVVQILDYGLHDGVPFIAMELLEGESLAARLARDGRFQSWQLAEHILRQVARAVGRAHDAGIVHRDLKPGNIFLVRNDEEEIVKLLDFGIAKSASPLDAPPSSSTRTGEFLGSPVYASPEQLQGSKHLDQRADIWSLGVIAYECFIGRPPFSEDTLVNLVLAVCLQPLPIPSQHGSVPPGFDAWFARACERDVTQRFQTVREASIELRRLVAAACGLPEVAPDTPLQTPFVPPVTLLDEVLAGMPPPAHSGTTLLVRPGAAAPRPSPEPPRRLALVMAGLSGLGVLALLLFALRALASRSPARDEPVERDVQSLSTVPASTGEPRAAEALAPAVTQPASQVEPAPPEPEPAPIEEVAPELVPPEADPAAPAQAEPAAPASAPPSPAAKPPGLAAPVAPEAPAERVPVTTPPWKPAREAQRSAAPRRAWLTITASSPAQVWIDGRPVGQTPLEDVRIAPGVHEIAFVRDGERSAEMVEIRAGEHKRVSQESGDPSPSAGGDGLDQAAVQRTIRSNSPAVRDDCWQRAVSARAPDAPGSARVNVTITVAPSGAVQSVDSAGVPAAYPQLAGCIEAKVSAWRFPSARGETVVNVPFVFVTE